MYTEKIWQWSEVTTHHTYIRLSSHIYCVVGRPLSVIAASSSSLLLLQLIAIIIDIIIAALRIINNCNSLRYYDCCVQYCSIAWSSMMMMLVWWYAKHIYQESNRTSTKDNWLSLSKWREVLLLSHCCKDREPATSLERERRVGLYLRCSTRQRGDSKFKFWWDWSSVRGLI